MTILEKLRWSYPRRAFRNSCQSSSNSALPVLGSADSTLLAPLDVADSASLDENVSMWTFRSVFELVNVFVSFFVPMTVLIWIYVRIYRAAHKNSERTRRNSLSGAHLDAVSAVSAALASRAPSR